MVVTPQINSRPLLHKLLSGTAPNMNVLRLDHLKSPGFMIKLLERLCEVHNTTLSVKLCLKSTNPTLLLQIPALMLTYTKTFLTRYRS